MPIIPQKEVLTKREEDEMQYDRERDNAHIEYNLELKKMDVEVQKLDVKWTQIFKLPITIIKLPLYCLLGIGYIVHAINKTEPSENFWKMLK